MIDSLEYVNNLIIEIFKVNKEKFIITPHFTRTYIKNLTGAQRANTVLSSTKEYYFAAFSWVPIGTNVTLLYARFNKDSIPALNDYVKSRTGADDNYNEWFTENVLFNQLATSEPIGCEGVIIVKGWKITFLDR